MLAVLLSLAMTQVQPSPQALVEQPINRKLPFSPLQRSQMVVTGGGNGLGFDVYPTITKAFDPDKEMPDLEMTYGAVTPDDKAAMTWKPTPENYLVTDDVILRLSKSRNGRPEVHTLEAIRYRDKRPWATIDRMIILFFDKKVFAVCLGDMDEDSPQFGSDFSLEQTADGHVQLDIDQHLSGTGACQSHSVFEINADGPKLIKITEGGRGR